MCSDIKDSRMEINGDFEAILANKKRKLDGQGQVGRETASWISELIENIDKGRLDETFVDKGSEDAILKDLTKLQNEFAKLNIGGNPNKDKVEQIDKKKHGAFLDMMVGQWNSKSYIGNLWRKEFPKGSPQAQHLTEMTPEQLDKFRKDWCKGHVEKLEMKKIQTTSWARVDKTKGKYRTLGNMVVEFGGWECEDAVKGALTVASKCTGLGPPWCKKHAQSELLEFLLLETEFEETFSTSWQMFKEEILSQEQPSIPNESGITGVNPKSSTSTAGEPSAAAKAKAVAAKAKGTIAVPKTSPPKQADNKSRLEVASMVKETSKVRRDYQSASAQYLDITSNMEEKQEWAWAKTSPMINKFKETWQHLALQVTDVGKEYIISDDIADMRKKYTDARLMDELRRFMGMKETIQQILDIAASMRTITKEMKID